MPDRKRTILLTGAAGYVAAQLLPEFTTRYRLRLVDVTDTDRQGRPVPGITIVDLTTPDPSGCAPLFQGVDAVIHLGYRHPPAGAEETPGLDAFDSEFANLRMAQNVYRCAFDAGVPRVVMASSNHAADWYEHNLIHRRKMETVSPDDLPLSDNFYGWCKASYELLGFVYASGTFGRKLEVVQIRIGAPREIAPPEKSPPAVARLVGAVDPGTDPALAAYKRNLGAHISARDLRQLFTRAIETPDISNEHGIPWLVVYGISNNTRAFWSLESARRALGYRPEDDSEVTYSDDIHRILTCPDAAAPGGRVGA